MYNMSQHQPMAYMGGYPQDAVLMPNSLTKKIQNYTFRLNEVLGKGNFSKVYRGVNQLTNQPVAIKVVELSSIKTRPLLDLLHSQIEIVKTLNHPNILRCYEVFSSANNCYIITQLCDGDLQSRIRSKGPMSQKQASKTIYEIFLGLKYLSEQSIVHRDFKIANILFNKGVAKIADFGFAKRTRQRWKDINIGSPIYMSPQALIQNVYGSKTDIWAFGVFMYEILHGDTPLGFCQSEAQLKMHIRVPIRMEAMNNRLSQDIRQLILRCLEIDQRKRYSIQDVENSRFIRRISSQFSYKSTRAIHPSLEEQQRYAALMNSMQVNGMNGMNGNMGMMTPPPMGNHFQGVQNNVYMQQPSSAGLFNGNMHNIRRPLTPQMHGKQGRDPSPIRAQQYQPKPPQTYNPQPQSPPNLLQPTANNKQPIQVQTTSNPSTVRKNNLSVDDTLQARQRNGMSVERSKRVQTSPPPVPNHLYKAQVQAPQRIINNNSVLSFQQYVNLLHYCRLVYKIVTDMSKIPGLSASSQRAYLTNWFFQIFTQIQGKVNKNVKFEGEKAQIRQRKLREVINEYHKKYFKELVAPMAKQTNFTGLQQKVSSLIKLVDDNINQNQNQDPKGKQQKIVLAHYLMMMHQANSMLRKAVQSGDYGLFLKKCNIEGFLSAKRDNFDDNSYKGIRLKIDKFGDI